MPNERSRWVLLGRDIGSASGWDQHDTFVFGLYDFTPAEGLGLPSGDVTIDVIAGTIGIHNDNGSLIESADLITALKDAKQVSPEA
jgi:hypothetical protein